MQIGKIIGLVIALVLMGVLLPIGLDAILGFTNDNSTIQTLVAIVVPVMAVIGIVISLIPKTQGND